MDKKNGIVEFPRDKKAQLTHPGQLTHFITPILS